MADAAWPTPGARARTPLSPSSPPGPLGRAAGSSTNMLKDSTSLVLTMSIIGPTRGSRDGVRGRWRVSGAGRPRLDLGEDVGRAAAFGTRVQWIAGLHQHDTNYHRRAAARGAGWRRWAAICLRGCSSAAAAWGRSRRVHPLLRPAARRSGTSADRGRRRPKWSARGVTGPAAAAVSACCWRRSYVV